MLGTHLGGLVMAAPARSDPFRPWFPVSQEVHPGPKKAQQQYKNSCVHTEQGGAGIFRTLIVPDTGMIVITELLLINHLRPSKPILLLVHKSYKLGFCE